VQKPRLHRNLVERLLDEVGPVEWVTVHDGHGHLAGRADPEKSSLLFSRSTS
jgi:hypothetical protein